MSCACCCCSRELTGTNSRSKQIIKLIKRYRTILTPVNLSQQVLSQHSAQPRKSDMQLFRRHMLGEPFCLLLDLAPVRSASNRYIIVTLCRCWRYCNMWRICILWKNIGRHLYKVIKYELSLELNQFVIYGGISWDDLLILMECHKREIWWNLQIFSGWSNVWLELLPRHHLLESSSHRLPAAVVTSTAESGFLAEFPGGLSWPMSQASVFRTDGDIDTATTESTNSLSLDKHWMS